MGHAAFGARYRRVRAMVLEAGTRCAHCHRRQATQLDHDPPLAMHVHRADTGCCRLIPSCEECNREGGRLVANGTWRPGVELAGLELEAERAGVDLEDPRWRVPWLEELLEVPLDATWPRLMTLPHPRATGTLARDFEAFARERSGYELRWWQRLAAARLLEHDRDGHLVWEAAVLTMARQLGKSWFLRELCLWRMHQGRRFGGPQFILHTGKDLAVCKEVQRPARVWAKGRRHAYRVREVNGQEEVELLEDGSRWALRAKNAVYGYTVDLGAVDEAWKVPAAAVDEGLTPTMAERIDTQLLLVSTAHRAATALMLRRRLAALAALESGEGDLLIEWSAPAGSELDDVAGWRAASPHWTVRRQRLIRARLDAMRTGEVDDPEEPDPEQSFRAQWLNQWPRKLAVPSGPAEPLLPEGLWAELAESVAVPAGVPVWAAVEDDYGQGAAVAAARRVPDGRIELDAWLRADWDTAIGDLERLRAVNRVRGVLVGASLLDRVPPLLRPSSSPRGASDTRTGLALLRDLALNGGVVHDTTTAQLDQALELATVKEATSGLYLLAKGPTHLIRAAVWALAAAHRPPPAPAVH